ncbi:hypothetical protein SAMN05518682_3286 [Cellulosimicrobium aquatile]|uniref:DUF8094 domain-containing protein n=1 Tax=Cellulosimicrobium aquatile TaxID=1612203 RepID=A0A1N6UPX8_9MICO|nr:MULTISPECIES: hypothetical protein [Cellulosimicrobium]MCM3534196.1 hypothetical protein [Cellulosimicrobium funkei]NMF30060.1 hypothetical protein [Cellulosimicrobium aquatile]SIQ67552.1 hypothetical protein SAMN05518682_3286 [Cellulosimicrobium aquatile]
MTSTARDTARARRARRHLGGVAGGLVGALLLAACSAPLPTPEPDPTQDPPAPVLTEAQETAVLDAVAAALAAASETNDAAQLEGRVTGPALAIRTSQLAVAAARGNADLVTELPTEAQQVVIPTTQTWPRTSFAVSVQPENLQTPRLSVLEQDTARGDYQLWAWVRLLPGVTMPSFADPSIGSEDVAPDDSSLLVTPTDAVAQYADVLNLGTGSGFAGSFEEDSFRTLLAKRAQDWTTALQPAAGAYSLTFTPNPDEPVRAVRTADGGALVVGAMTSQESMTAEEGAQVPPDTESIKALYGGAAPTNVLKVGYVDVVALYVPPAGSEEKIRVVGNEHVATSVANS